MPYDTIITDDDNLHNWSSRTLTYDDLGNLIRSSVTFDDGHQITETYTDGVRVRWELTDPLDALVYDNIEALYDAAGVITQKTVTFDNGHQVFETYTGGVLANQLKTYPASSPPYASIETLYDAAGATTQRILTGHDGTTLTQTYTDGVITRWLETEPLDGGGSQVVKDELFDTNGLPLEKMRVEADGREITETYTNGVIASRVETDPLDARDYSSIEILFDAAGAATQQTTVFDDGREIVQTYTGGVRTSRVETDPLDAVSPFERIEILYDAAGVPTQKRFVYDDGRDITETYTGGVVTSWVATDPQDLQSFDRIEILFDAAGAKTQQTTTYDDGREIIITYTNGVIASRVETDPLDALGYASTETLYDAAGVPIQKTTVYDDGREVTETFSNGVIASRLETDPLDARGFASSETLYDAAGVPTQKTIVYDDGREVTETYTGGVLAGRVETDPLNGYGFASIETLYDAAGVPTQKTTIDDNGREITVTYANGVIASRVETDPLDALGYDSIETLCDAAGLPTQKTILYDDDRVVIETYAGGVLDSWVATDPLDVHSFDRIEIVFDAAGVPTQRTSWYDDGRVIVAGLSGGPNDAPTANDDSYAWPEDQIFEFSETSLTLNDSDPDGDPLTIIDITDPQNGTLVQVGTSANGKVYHYTPDANFSGPDTMTYTVADGKGGTDTATLTMNVTAINDAPTANDDSFAWSEDQVFEFSEAALTQNDSDPDGDPLTIIDITDPLHGTLELVGTSVHGDVYHYTPDANFNGPDTMTYTVSDGNGGTDTATLTMNIIGLNDAPVFDIPTTPPAGSLTPAAGWDTPLLVAENVDASQFSEDLMTVLTNGNIVVTSFDFDHEATGWPDREHYVSVFAPDGTLINTAPIIFSSNVLASENDLVPDNEPANVVATADGGFAVVWTDHVGFATSAHNNQIRIEFFDENGVSTGPETGVLGDHSRDINDGTAFLFSAVMDVVGLDTGGVAIAINRAAGLDDPNIDFNHDLHVLVVSPAGTLTTTVTVDASANNASQARLTAIDGGGFLVTWNETAIGGAPLGEGHAQVFDSTGTAVSSKHLLGANLTGDYSVTQLADGSFAIVRPAFGGADNIKIELLAADGSSTGPSVEVDPGNGTYNSRNPAITALDDGGFAVVFSSGLAIVTHYVQTFNADGSLRGDAQQIAQFPQSAYDPEIRVSPTGVVTVMWQDAGTPGGDGGTDGQNFYAQSFVLATGQAPDSGNVTEQPDGAPDEGSALHTTGGTLPFEDLDTGDGHTVGHVANGVDYLGTFAVAISDPAQGDGSGAVDWSFEVPDYQLEALAEGEQRVQSYDVTVSDPDGATDIVTVTVTLTGANDGPSLQYGFESVEEDGFEAVVNLAALGNDPDSDDTGSSLTYELITGPGLGEGTAWIDGAQLRFDPGLDFQWLGESNSQTVSLQVSATDAHGATTQNAIDITVLGRNDAPEVMAIDAGAVSEDDAAAVIGLIAGQTDIDAGALLSPQGITVTDDLGAPVAFTDNFDGTITIDPAQYDALNDGESRTLTVDYEVSDGFAATPNTATLVVNGVTDNTAPVAGDDVLASGPAGEFLVNEVTYSRQIKPAIAQLVGGGLVVTWSSLDRVDDTSGYGIKARILNADGSEAVGEFLVNEETNGSQYQTAVTALAGGGFVVTWNSADGVDDTSSTGVKARIFNADGTEAVGEFLVNEETNNAQHEPAVTALAGGGFVVTWHSDDGVDDTSGDGVKARIFNADGTEAVSEFLVNEETNNLQYVPAVAALSGGGFVVTWNSNDGVDDTSSDGVKARIFNADGTEAVSEFLVNEETYHHQREPAVTALVGGGFVVAWRSRDGVDDTSGEGTKARIFNADGTEAVSEFLVNEETNGDQFGAAVTALAGGGFVVTWFSYAGVDDVSGSGIKGRIFNADGTEAVSEFLVNEVTNSDQRYPAVTALENGGFVVTWESTDGVDDTSLNGIKARIFNADGTPAVGAVTDEDTPLTIAAAELLANDSDPDGDPLTITDVSATSTLGAAVTLNGDGSVGYDPTTSATLDALAAGEQLTDTFSYDISDANGGTDTATVTLVVTGVNDAPTLAYGFGSAVEDGFEEVFDLAALGGDPDSDDTGLTLTYEITQGPAPGEGTAWIDGTQLRFFPGMDFQELGAFGSQTVTLQVTATDAHGAIAQNFIDILVSGQNDLPEVTPIDAGSVSEDDAGVVIDLLASQTDIDIGDLLSASAITVTDDLGNPVAFTDNFDNTITIDPAQYDALDDGESRTLTVSYDVSDGHTSVPNTATLVVNGAADAPPPVANDDVILGDLDFAGTGSTAGLATALNDGSALGSFSATTVYGSGKVGLDAATGDINGDGFADVVVGTFQSPTVVYLNDGSGGMVDAMTNQGSGWVEGIMLGDLDGDGDLDLGQANYGVAVGDQIWLNNGAGVFTNTGQALPGPYRQENGTFGDVDGDGDLDYVSADLETGMRVFANNGSGVFADSGQSLGTGWNRSVKLADFDGDGDLDMAVARGHEDGSGLANQIWTNDGSGVFSLAQSLGSSPDWDVAVGDLDNDGDLDLAFSSSTGLFSVFFNDGTGQFSAQPVLSGLGEGFGTELGDIDFDGDLDAIVSDQSGNRNMLLANDGTGVFTVAGQISNAPGARTPLLVDLDHDGLQTDRSYTFRVLDNDSDPQGETLSLSGVDATSASGAALSVAADGRTVVYDPTAAATLLALGEGESATDTFTYTVVNESGKTATATVSVLIAGINDDPIAADDPVGEYYDQGEIPGSPLLFSATDLLANDTDPDGDPLTITGVSDFSAQGVYVILEPDGSVTYEAQSSSTLVGLGADEALIDTFTYTIEDPDGGTDSATVTLTYIGANDVPVVNGDTSGEVWEDDFNQTEGFLFVDDFDFGESGTMAASGPSINGYGEFSVDANGNWAYTLDDLNPAVDSLAGFEGLNDFFLVWSADGTVSQEVHIIIHGSNDPATITGDTTGTVTKDGPLSAGGTLLVDDVDTGENALWPVELTPPNYGFVLVEANGSWVYELDDTRPEVEALNPGETLVDTFTVESTDHSATQEITITIQGGNGDPQFALEGAGPQPPDGFLL